VVRLFDPFFQVGTGVQRNFQGTGLGLAICEKLISMMDGDIAVETEPGMGSRFTIRIPLYGVQNRRRWMAWRANAAGWRSITPRWRCSSTAAQLSR
jgi:signal transduction histidine kinase